MSSGRLIDIAEIIVIRLGATAGVSHELEEIIARGKIGRTIFVPWRTNKQDSVQAFARVMARIEPLPAHWDAVPGMRAWKHEQDASQALSHVTGLLWPQGRRRVPFYGRTDESVRDAAKMLGLAERPDRLLTATKIVGTVGLLSPGIAFLLWVGCQATGANECPLAEATIVPALVAFAASFGLAGVLYSLSVT